MKSTKIIFILLISTLLVDNIYCRSYENDEEIFDLDYYDDEFEPEEYDDYDEDIEAQPPIPKGSKGVTSIPTRPSKPIKKVLSDDDEFDQEDIEDGYCYEYYYMSRCANENSQRCLQLYSDCLYEKGIDSYDKNTKTFKALLGGKIVTLPVPTEIVNPPKQKGKPKISEKWIAEKGRRKQEECKKKTGKLCK